MVGGKERSVTNPSLGRYIHGLPPSTSHLKIAPIQIDPLPHATHEAYLKHTIREKKSKYHSFDCLTALMVAAVAGVSARCHHVTPRESSGWLKVLLKGSHPPVDGLAQHLRTHQNVSKVPLHLGSIHGVIPMNVSLN